MGIVDPIGFRSAVQPVTERPNTYDTPNTGELVSKNYFKKGISANQVEKHIQQTPLQFANSSLFKVPPPNDEKANIEKQATDLLAEIIAIGEQDFGDDFSFERALNYYYQAMFAMVENDEKAMASSLSLLHEEIKKMSDERAKEFEKVLEKIKNNKWFECIGLGATIVGGAAAATIVSSSGWGAVVVVLGVTLALAALSADRIFDDFAKRHIAEMWASVNGQSDDTQYYKNTLNILRIASTLAEVGLALANIAVAATNIASSTSAFTKALGAASSTATGVSQVGLAVNEKQTATIKAKKIDLDHQLEYNNEQMNVLQDTMRTTYDQYNRYQEQYVSLLRQQKQASSLITS